MLLSIEIFFNAFLYFNVNIIYIQSLSPIFLTQQSISNFNYMFKWQQDDRKETKNYIDYDTKRKIAAKKLEVEPEPPKTDQQAFIEKQNQSLLKRVILLEQRTRDYQDLSNANQNLAAKLDQLDTKLHQLFEWAQNLDQNTPPTHDYADTIAQLETQIQNIAFKVQNDMSTKELQSIVQTDLNTLFDLIQQHDQSFKDSLQTSKDFKKEISDIHSKIQHLETKLQYPKNPDESILHGKENDQADQLKKAKSLLNFQKCEVNSGFDKFCYAQPTSQKNSNQIEYFQSKQQSTQMEDVQNHQKEEHDYYNNANVESQKKQTFSYNHQAKLMNFGNKKYEQSQKLLQNFENQKQKQSLLAKKTGQMQQQQQLKSFKL